MKIANTKLRSYSMCCCVSSLCEGLESVPGCVIAFWWKENRAQVQRAGEMFG